jgi:hypothetical protein
MAEQLTFTTMAGETVAVRKRGKHYVQPRGYARPPGSGPAGETCKSCQHITRIATRAGKVFRKCGLMQKAWTHGPGTDIRAGAAACSLWQKQEPKP